MLTRLRDKIRPFRVATVAFMNTVVFGILASITRPLAFSRRRIPDFFIWSWAKIFVFFSGSKLEIVGSENFNTDEPHVIMANHASYFDPPFLMVALRNKVKFIMKAELGRIPLFSWALNSAGHIFLERKNPRKARESLQKASKWLRKGISVVIFPEGTIGPGKLLPFRNGGFKLALENKVRIIPVTITNTRQAFGEKGFFKVSKQHIKIIIEKPLETTVYTKEKLGDLQEHVKNAIEKNIISVPAVEG